MSDRPGTVTSLECGKPHPDLGWCCHRLRGHSGSHMAADPFPDEGKPVARSTWYDFRECCDTYPGTDHLIGCTERQRPGPLPPVGSTDTPEEHTAMLERIPDPPPAVPESLERIRRCVAALLVLAVLVAALCAPAVVIAAWRWAL